MAKIGFVVNKAVRNRKGVLKVVQCSGTFVCHSSAQRFLELIRASSKEKDVEYFISFVEKGRRTA